MTVGLIVCAWVGVIALVIAGCISVSRQRDELARVVDAEARTLP